MSDRTEQTKVLDVDDGADEVTTNIDTAAAQAEAQRQADEAEEQRRAEEARRREEERAAREKALGAVPTTDDDDMALPPPPRPDNDKFAGSLGLGLLRLALAAILGVRGIQVLFDISGTATWLGDRHVPQGTITAWLLGIGLLIVTLLLLIGFGVRVIGLLVAALAITVLVYIEWGYTSIFVEGQAGFTGDWNVLVACLGLALLCLGSGGWAVDAAMRSNRAKRKLYQ